MSRLSTTLSKPMIFLAAMAYFALLCISLIGWHMEPEVVLLFTVSGIGLMMMTLWPYFGIHVFIFTLFVENAVSTGDEISPMKVLGVVILLSWLLNVAIQRKSGLKFDGFTAVLLLFLVWCCVSMVNAMDTQLALSRTFQYTQYALATLMVTSVVDTPDRIRRLYWSFSIWATLGTLVAMLMYYRGMTLTASGLVGNRNLLATYINIAIVCAYLLYQGARSGPGRLTLMLTLPVLFLGLGLTLSRGGLVSLGVILVIVWYRVARQRGFLLLAGSIAMICLLIYVLPNAFWARAGTIVPAIEQNKETFGARVKLWTVASRMVRDHPIVGVGPGNFILAYPRYAKSNEQYLSGLSTHNAYFGVTAEHGLVGGALFFLIIGFALRGARRAFQIGKKTGQSDLQIHGIVAEVSLFALLLSGLTGDVYGTKCLWVFFGLAMAMERMADRVVSEQRSMAVKEPAAMPEQAAVPWNLARNPH